MLLTFKTMGEGSRMAGQCKKKGGARFWTHTTGGAQDWQSAAGRRVSFCLPDTCQRRL
jgi:hypothetical protein